MELKVVVEKEFTVDIDESVYTTDVLEQFKNYWGLTVSDADVFEHLAEHIIKNIINGVPLDKIEGISNVNDAHKVLETNELIEVSNVI